MQFSTRSAHVLHVLLHLALCFTGGTRVAKWEQTNWSVLERGLHPCRGVRMSLLGSQTTAFSLLLVLLIKTVTDATNDDERKALERCWLFSFYLRCSMTKISPLSGSKPFMNKPPFLARGVVRPCSPASFLSRSSLKLTDMVLLGRVSSEAGLNPRSEDSLRLIEAARWNLS